jgi:hypothetical protein
MMYETDHLFTVRLLTGTDTPRAADAEIMIHDEQRRLYNGKILENVLRNIVPDCDIFGQFPEFACIELRTAPLALFYPLAALVPVTPLALRAQNTRMGMDRKHPGKAFFSRFPERSGIGFDHHALTRGRCARLAGTLPLNLHDAQVTSRIDTRNRCLVTRRRLNSRISIRADFTVAENPGFGPGSGSGREIRMVAEAGDIDPRPIRRI